MLLKNKDASFITHRNEDRTVYKNYLYQKTRVDQGCQLTVKLQTGGVAEASLVTKMNEAKALTPCEEIACVISSSACPSLVVVIPPIITTDLIIHFEANDTSSYPGSGLTWFNIGTGGSAYNGTLSGTTKPVFVATAPKSFSFTRNQLNSPTDYLTYNYISVPRPSTIGDDFTFCAWINTTGVGYGTNHYQLMYIVSTETVNINNDFGFGINNAGQLAYGDGKSGGSDITINTTETVSTGSWLFVAVTRKKSNGDVNLYINGVLKKNGTCNSGNTLSQASTMLIGSESDSIGFTFGGNMGAFLANTSVLTADQILQNFNAQKANYGL